MIFELNKNLYAMSSDYPILDEECKFFCSFDMIKGGINIYNVKSSLIAQLLSVKNGIEISIADSPAMFITNNYEINSSALSSEDKADITSPEKQRVNANQYFVFGNPNSFQYDLYLKLKGDLKPVVAANIIPNTWKEDRFKVRINEDCNQLKILTMILAFAVIANGGLK